MNSKIFFLPDLAKCDNTANYRPAIPTQQYFTLGHHDSASRTDVSLDVTWQ
jgi:hypothetical protein